MLPCRYICAFVCAYAKSRFSHDITLLIFFLQGAACPDPTMVFVDLRALRNDRVTLVEKGSPHSLCLMESGKVCKFRKVPKFSDA